MDQKPDIRQQEAYYTHRWNAFEYGNIMDLERITAVLDVLTRTGFETTPSICDLGCGAGWATNILGTFGRTTGVDLSDTSVAASRYPHCAFVSANILEWVSPPELFDVVVSLEVIEHIDRPSQARYVDVASRILKPGGHLILTTPNAETMRLMPEGGRAWSNQPLEEWLTDVELHRTLSARFDVESIESIVTGFGSGMGRRIAHSPKVGAVMKTAGMGDAWRRFVLGRMFGLHLVAHARKPASHST